MFSISLFHVTHELASEKKKRRNLLSVKTRVSLRPGIKAAFNRIGVTFERSLTPSKGTSIVCDFDEQPSRRNTEILDRCNLTHDELEAQHQV
jgi:hypothetical protein